MSSPSPSPLRRSPRKRKSKSYAQAPGSNNRNGSNTKRRVVAELQTHCEEGKYSNHTKENTDNDDDELFHPIPPKDDCPLCFSSLPIEYTDNLYMSCCGKLICTGCYKENIRVTREQGPQRQRNPPCPSCTAPYPASENEHIIRIKKRMEVNDSEAIFVASHCYKSGEYGVTKDPQLALDLCLRAADLGHPVACHNVARLYKEGVDVAKDMTEARKYNKMAVKKGHIKARINLGVDEWNNGNYRVACRHWLLSAGAGHTNSMANIAELYWREVVTKNEVSVAFASYKNVHKDE